jgi:hypothetical protein
MIIGVALLAFMVPKLSALPTEHDVIVSFSSQQAFLRSTPSLTAAPRSPSLFSNNPGSVWSTTGHTAYLVPQHRFPTTQLPNAGFDAQSDELTRIITETDGLVVLFQFTFGSGSEITDFTNRGLAILADCEGITILGVADSSQARETTSAVCRSAS